jgi:acetate kinase
VFAIDAPGYPRPLFITDAAVNVTPVLDDQRDIVQNAIELAHALGIANPRVAIRVAGRRAGWHRRTVFTAGIGEHAAQIRQHVCDAAAWLGVELDVAGNRAGGPRLTRAGSKVSAWVIPTDEDLMIAGHTWRLLGMDCDPGDGGVQGRR